ncbi:lycopene cyclase domain-containing protein [Spirochaeta cellobiosiphila]|uniref:lycopene cyclase domain-containing protein n=1 Tax=Spirochaeta cellobiosiphila TaxID=504483 RepID=UPI000428F8A2|nr:lycopene cyclase domain-containing protein [Spirochaeta cellobiosiphila]
MSLYIILNIIILGSTLIFSFDKRVSFYKVWPKMGLIYLTVSVFFIVWDMWATHQGHWSFNPRYTGVKIGNLPLGEILFFISVPYSCMFLWEIVNYFFPKTHNRKKSKSIVVTVIVMLLFAVAAIVFWQYEYTRTVCIVAIPLPLLLYFYYPYPLVDTRSIVYCGAITVAFVITNGILTGLPVVNYGEGHYLGLRVLTIPVEDFVYNFCLIGYSLLIRIK